MALEAGMSRLIAGSVHFPKQDRRVHGRKQLPKAGSAQAGARTGIAQIDLSSDPAHDCHAGAKEGPVKDVQGLLRHSRAATTTDVYMQEIPERVQATINTIHAEHQKEAGINASRLY